MPQKCIGGEGSALDQGSLQRTPEPLTGFEGAAGKERRAGKGWETSG